MVAEISSYTIPHAVQTLPAGNVLGHRLALKQWFWCSAGAEAWLGEGDFYSCAGGEVVSADVLPPGTVADGWRKPVFLSETRRELFAHHHWFSRGALLRLLFRNCFESVEVLHQSPHDNIFLLAEEKIAVVHWLSAYGCWQLHVTQDWSFMISPGTKFFVLQYK